MVTHKAALLYSEIIFGRSIHHFIDERQRLVDHLEFGASALADGSKTFLIIRCTVAPGVSMPSVNMSYFSEHGVSWAAGEGGKGVDSPRRVWPQITVKIPLAMARRLGFLRTLFRRRLGAAPRLLHMLGPSFHWTE